MFASITNLKEISTPTVGQLREALDGLPDDAPVIVGFGFGKVIHGAGSHDYNTPDDETPNCVCIEEDDDD